MGPGPRLMEKKNLPGRCLTKFEKHFSSTISCTTSSSRSFPESHICKSRSSPNDIDNDIFASHCHELTSSEICDHAVQLDGDVSVKPSASNFSLLR